MSLKLIETNIKAETKKDELAIFKLMNSQNSIPLKKVNDGQTISVNYYVIFEITKEDSSEEPFESVVLANDDMTMCYATRSGAVIKYLRDLINNYGNDVFNENLEFIKNTQTSASSGHDYITIDLSI